ncbi:probable serine/threonine-protein kinase kinX [Macadamia integrifolia]|uniref:probable serine/threonine-protein kinase kinX n=1 Tax=Macadamia integrifolia TaxID=60698 RepID=UPI001C527BDF|nr:probable serine/threonine-protein kinase kinX [Macadamia integrifolia]
MMESQRPHRSGSTSSELFICFTSRHSSSSASSMKISSKSILSPARTDKLREPTLSLSSSLSRRLRSNGSMKGGQASPMFPTGNKKRGSTFETPEPSSPKVTCIGQVRVKTKKQGKKMRTRSKRRGEMSFRKTEQSQEGIQQQQHHQECLPHRNQRWVHIPLTICEALRAFGSDFNCFLPCRSSCFSSNEREKGEKTKTNTSSSSSCGAIFARWLMAIQEGEEEKRTEITLVVEQEKMAGEKTEAVNVMKTSEKGEVEEEIEGEVDERVSICIPPKNALLLMRCRSEPFRMSSFANTFWDSPATKEDNHVNEDDDEDSEEEDDDERQISESEEEKDYDNAIDDDEEENVEEVKGELYEKQGEEEMAAEALGEPPNLQENEEDSELRGNPPAATDEVEKGEENLERVVEGDSEEQDHQPEEPSVEDAEEQILEIGSSVEALEELEEEANYEGKETSLLESTEEAEVEGEEEARRTSSSSSSSSSSVVVSIQPALEEGGGEEAEEQQEVVVELVLERESVGLTETADAVASKETVEESKKEETADRAPEVEIETEEEIQKICVQAPQEQQQNQTNEEDQNVDGPGEGEATQEAVGAPPPPPPPLNQIHEKDQNEAEDKLEEREKKSKLPDCLLMMMCEPKLSMEVSKETWVCSTDFIRSRPGKQPVIPKDGGEESKKRVSTDSNAAQQQQNPQQQSHQKQQHQQQQEARKSCSNSNHSNLPPAVVALPSMASMIEQKLVNAKAYEPFVLTRCKSEPMRSSAKLAPEACFWKNRRLEPHPPTTLGVGGGAGVGF